MVAKKTADEFCKGSYDYVIVGGGTAGLAVAARLSEDERVQVAVLEAGELRDEDPKISTPMRSFELGGDPTYDWQFKTVPQSHMDDRVVDWPRGKVVGGTSAINHMLFVRGAPPEYDDWEALGNDGWNWSTLEPYFKKVEKFSPVANGHATARKSFRLSDQGNAGPVNTTVSNDLTEVNALWKDTWNNLGVPTAYPAAEDPLGVQFTKSTVDASTATRSSSMSAYYLPNEKRSNLHLLTGALVESIKFSDKGSEPVATGVQLSVDGERYICNATSEVILCTGTVLSPAILERSGIGSKHILDKHGIQVTVDNPGVGENLQDHNHTTAVLEMADEKYSLDRIVTNPEALQAAFVEYTESRTGTLANTVNAASYLSFYQVCRSIPPPTAPACVTAAQGLGIQQQYDLLLKRLRDPKAPSFQFQMAPVYSETLTGPRPPGIKGPISIMNAVSASFSRGSIHISSANPEDHPTIDPRCLELPIDRQLFAAATQQCLEFAGSAPLSEAVNSIVAPSKLLSTSEEYDADTRHALGTFYHPIGTCSMRPRNAGGVVDTSLRVYGTKNLRVVDASIMPLHISGNIQWTVYAIAEKAADIIKNERE